ncbi:hypothetical protein FGL89_06830 [Leuconostoc carnosum]|uniref:Uncharacterized protein n=2 Tax=Leuconostoc carnosum TaxID=1252 RepID=K0DB57_LEUCJ|nr:hypothetical protein [Leuconostoc carnosum]AFT82103.1 hypothetical protein C270_05970 [Leuconostoc carnosum JB16]KAA8327637.1 hypothetical protein FE409_06310 [Leuconostoc carnosum]QEA33857.1 hypothetical protein FGL89_06830 [Leuconostoc carnosum]
MSKSKGFLAGILVSAAAIMTFKSLPKSKQQELKEKTTKAGVVIRDMGYDTAYLTADMINDVTDKAKVTVTNLKRQGQDKYGDKIDVAADHMKQFSEQATPYVDKAKDIAGEYVEKAQNSLSDFRGKLTSDDIELTQEDIALEDALLDLSDDVQEEVADKTEEVKKSVNETVDQVTEDISEKNK